MFSINAAIQYSEYQETGRREDDYYDHFPLRHLIHASTQSVTYQVHGVVKAFHPKEVRA